MPQELQVLQCFSCETFQVHIIKKSTKWNCKMCNEKQSVKKIFGKGTGKDCRLFVQNLNKNRLNKENSKTEIAVVSQNEVLQILAVSTKSKWSDFADSHVEEDQIEIASDSNEEINTSLVAGVRNSISVKGKQETEEKEEEDINRFKLIKRRKTNESNELSDNNSNCNIDTVCGTVLSHNKEPSPCDNIFNDENEDLDVLLKL